MLRKSAILHWTPIPISGIWVLFLEPHFHSIKIPIDHENFFNYKYCICFYKHLLSKNHTRAKCIKYIWKYLLKIPFTKFLHLQDFRVGGGYIEEGMMERVLGHLHHWNLVLLDKSQGRFRLEGTWMKLLLAGDSSARASYKYMF